MSIFQSLRPVLLLLLWVVPSCDVAPPSVGPAAGPSAPEIAPHRIVSMSPALTEILFAVGVGPRVAGVTRFCDYPPEVARLPRIGGYVNPSIEAILALRPDLVLVSPAGGNRDAGLALQRAGVRLEVIPAETLSETYAAIERVGVVCGVPGRGRAVVAGVRGRIERASSRVRALPKVRTLFCLEIEPIIAAGRGTLPSELLELAGGSNVVEAERYPRLGLEAVLVRAPEVILQTRMDAADPAASARAEAFWRRWPTLPAVSTGRVFVLDASTALRPGPRVADAVETLSALLHPAAPAAVSEGKP